MGENLMNRSEAGKITKEFVQFYINCVEKWPNIEDNPYLTRPQTCQPELKADLKACGIQIPESVFVAFDTHSMVPKISIHHKNSELETTTLEGNLLVEKFRSIVDGSATRNPEQIFKHENEAVTIEIPTKLKDNSVVVILPFLMISYVKFDFEDEEIILSTC